MSEADPSLPALHRSWQRFKIGLALFVVGAAIFMALSQFHPLLYWTALAILLTGFAIAMSGYFGILWQRLKGINPAAKRRRNDPFR